MRNVVNVVAFYFNRHACEINCCAVRLNIVGILFSVSLQNKERSRKDKERRPRTGLSMQ